MRDQERKKKEKEKKNKKTKRKKKKEKKNSHLKMETLELLSLSPMSHELDSILSIGLGGPLRIKRRAQVGDPDVVLQGWDDRLVPGLANEGLQLGLIHFFFFLSLGCQV